MTDVKQLTSRAINQMRQAKFFGADYHESPEKETAAEKILAEFAEGILPKPEAKPEPVSAETISETEKTLLEQLAAKVIATESKAAEPETPAA